ncbi:MAG: hypothetical protein U5L09_10560 [Bacteroidales bacterium]|nr:hypothetical protein [Bacteroidales bacterium]
MLRPAAFHPTHRKRFPDKKIQKHNECKRQVAPKTQSKRPGVRKPVLSAYKPRIPQKNEPYG